ncbi:MAG: hypothetical protein FWG66_10470 [Spirochaetes bacterium]|nr:hypothetical protein [Spirochaetota bacterium]
MNRKMFAVLTAVVLSLAIPAAAMAQTTAMQARETALQITNGGTVMGLEQVNEAGGASMFHVIVDNNVRFNVFVAVSNGDVVRITTEQMPGNTLPSNPWGSPWGAGAGGYGGWHTPGSGWHTPSHGWHSPGYGWHSPHHGGHSPRGRGRGGRGGGRW